MTAVAQTQILYLVSSQSPCHKLSLESLLKPLEADLLETTGSRREFSGYWSVVSSQNSITACSTQSRDATPKVRWFTTAEFLKLEAIYIYICDCFKTNMLFNNVQQTSPSLPHFNWWNLFAAQLRTLGWSTRSTSYKVLPRSVWSPLTVDIWGFPWTNWGNLTLGFNTKMV